MDPLEFILRISWQVVILVGLLVTLIYRKPLGDLLSRLRRGSVSSKKGEGLSVDLEADRPGEGLPRLEGYLKVEQIEILNADGTLTNEVMSVEVKDEAVEAGSWIELFYDGRYEEARKIIVGYIKELESTVPENDSYLTFLKARAAEALYNYDFIKGKEEFEYLIRNNPEGTIYYIEYFRVLQASGDVDKINSLLDEYPGSKSKKYDLMLRKANLLYEGSDFDQAKIVANELGSQNDNVVVKARAHLLMGKIVKKENPQHTTGWLIKAYKIFPKDELLLGEIADLFYETNSYRLALFFRHQQLQLNKNSSTHWGHIGNVYLTLNMYSHAMRAYEKAEEISSGTEAWIIANIGNLYNNAKFYDKAIEFLSKAAEMQPLDEYATNRLASALSEKEKEDKQIQEIIDEVRTIILKIDGVQESVTVAD